MTFCVTAAELKGWTARKPQIKIVRHAAMLGLETGSKVTIQYGNRTWDVTIASVVAVRKITRKRRREYWRRQEDLPACHSGKVTIAFVVQLT